MSNSAAAAGFVDHDDGFSELFLKLFGEKSGHAIGAAAGRPRADQGDAAGWITRGRGGIAGVRTLPAIAARGQPGQKQKENEL
jgi:hypothetical protein